MITVIEDYYNPIVINNKQKIHNKCKRIKYKKRKQYNKLKKSSWSKQTNKKTLINNYF